MNHQILYVQPDGTFKNNGSYSAHAEFTFCKRKFYLGRIKGCERSSITVVKPYYQDDLATIYNVDCAELLGELDGFLVTDPPYGINLKRPWQENPVVGIHGDELTFDPRHLIRFKDAIIWGGNNFAQQLPPGGWLCWDKRCSREADRMYGSAFELAWCSDRSKFKFFRLLHGGVVNADGNELRIHPTQKPIELIEWCISLFSNNKVIIDPYMGSGTTLRAASNFQRRSIGIEIEEKYCEAAAKRLQQLTIW